MYCKLQRARTVDWKLNIPFASVPEAFIRARKAKYFSYEEYLESAELYDELPTYWNMALYDGEEIKIFVYGLYDPLEKIMHVIHIAKHPSLDDSYLAKTAHIIKLFAQGLDLKTVFFITNRWRSFAKKLDGVAYINDKAKVMELY